MSHGTIESTGNSIYMWVDNIEDKGSSGGQGNGGETTVTTLLGGTRMCLPYTGDMVDANIEDMTGCLLTVGGGDGVQSVDGVGKTACVGGR